MKQGTPAMLAAAALLWSVNVAADEDPPTPPAAGKLAVFFVTDRPAPPQPQPLQGRVLHALDEQGRSVAQVELSPRPPQSIEDALKEARAASSQAFTALGRGDAPDDVLQAYGPRITEALGLASAVNDAEGRDLLWNACLLRVQLLLMSEHGPDGAPTRRAVSECRRRFADQRAFSRAWSPDVVELLQRRQGSQVQLGIRSAPAGCEVRLFGGTVGTTPLRLQVERGAQEVQVRCDGWTSLVHRLQLETHTDIVIRPSADRAWRRAPGGASWLVYEDDDDARQAPDDAAALAGEAGADGFLLVRLTGGRAQLAFFRDGAQRSAAEVPVGASQQEVTRAVARLLDPSAPAAPQPPPVGNKGARWLSYASGAGLLAGGLGLSSYPVLALLRDGQCVETACARRYDGRGTKTWVALGLAAGLTIGGVTLLALRPFERRAELRLRAGWSRLSVEGRF